jgi:hypothetical protein
MRVDEGLFWPNIFQFPSDQGSVESVVWRAKAVSIEAAHGLGCEKQTYDRSIGRSRSTYFGAITALVGDIRSIRANGHFVTVDHVPDEGEAHVHLGFSPDARKVDRNSLKFLLSQKFGALEPHTCP